MSYEKLVEKIANYKFGNEDYKDYEYSAEGSADKESFSPPPPKKNLTDNKKLEDLSILGFSKNLSGI